MHGQVAEGYSSGFPGDASANAYSTFEPLAANPASYWAYGCWFHLHARGSGVFVNVRRSLRVANRSEAHAALAIPYDLTMHTSRST